MHTILPRVFVAASCLFWLSAAVWPALCEEAAEADENARVVKFIGKTEIYQWGMWHDAEEGKEVRPGETVRVVGRGEVVLEAAGGKVVLSARDNSTVVYNGMVDTRIPPWKNSRLAKDPEYRPDDDAPTVRQFYCPEGEVTVQVRTGEELNMVTPLITASVRGTMFRMNVLEDASSEVSVGGGKVDVLNRMGTSVPAVGSCGKSAMSSKQFMAYLCTKGYCFPPDADWRDYDYEAFEALDEENYARYRDGAADVAAPTTTCPEPPPPGRRR